MTVHLKFEGYTVSGSSWVLVSSGGSEAVSPVSVEEPFNQNVITGMPTVSHGPIVLTLFECTVISTRTGVQRRVPVISVQGILAMDHGETQTAYIDLPRHAFLRVILVDEDGLIDTKERCIGLVTGQGTLEGVVNQEGYLDFFVPSGPVTAYVFSQRERVEFSVDAAYEESGVVQVRVRRSSL